MKKFPILYHKTAKGATNIWEVWADGDTVFTKWGQLDGKMQESSKKVTEKNIGKKNATTLEQQAELEAESMWKFKLERKYSETIEDTEEKIFLPMLAKSFDKRKRFLSDDDYPMHGQPKLDGVRCLAHWKDGQIHLMSRGGKTYKLPHLSAELEGCLPKDIVLDGELYGHGLSLQEINRLVRRVKTYKPESVKIEYRVYDYVHESIQTIPWHERCAALNIFFKEHGEYFNKVVKVPNALLKTETEVYEFQSKCLEEGFEGAIVRHYEGVYKFGYRSDKLLKVKNFQDAEFEIVGYTNGKGKFSECIIYECVTQEGKKFNVVPKGTFEERAEWLKNGDEHVGQKLTVEFFAWTEDNVPQFPVGKAIRLPEDMD